MARIITFSGKGGVGKTTTTALLLDELARRGYHGRLLVVDGDPAMTLHLALGQPPAETTLADVRDSLRLDAATVQALPAGLTPAAFVARELRRHQVLRSRRLREMQFDLLAMGWGEGRPGCYCQINNLLGTVLEQLVSRYTLIVVDNEAGLEHLSRYRIRQVDLFVIVEDGHLASQVVGNRIRQVGRAVGMRLGQELTVCITGVPERCAAGALRIPYTPVLDVLMSAGESVSRLAGDSAARQALRPLVAAALGEAAPVTRPLHGAAAG